MNLTRIMKLSNLVALVGLVLCLSAGLGKAQDVYRGKFTLPFEAHWQGAVLPAGDYMISLPRPLANGIYVLYVRREGKTVMILAGSPDIDKVSNQSRLTISSTGGNEAITALELGQFGWTFDYAMAKAKAKEMAQVQLPVQDGATGRGGR